MDPAAPAAGPAAAPPPPPPEVAEAAGLAVRRARELGRPVLLSWSLAAPGATAADALRFLAAGEAPRMYFRPPGGPAMAGLGVACAVEAQGPGRFDEVRLRARALLDHAVLATAHEDAPGPRFVGGFAFADDHEAQGPWARFPAARFVVPGVALIAPEAGEDGRTARAPGRAGAWVTVSRLVEGAEDGDALARHLAALAARAARPAPAPGKEAPGVPLPAFGQRVLERDEWVQGVEAALQAMRRGAPPRLRKVVLARRVPVPLTAPLGGHVALARLAQAYPEAFLYLVEPGPGRTFLGATPERLARLQDREVHSMALAGSAPRGASHEEDAQRARELQASAKEQREHAVVREAVTGALRDAGVELDEVPAAPKVLRLANVQHLHTPLRGRAGGGMHVLDLVAALHPTPAVGGAPREVALRFLRVREGFPRGWYAGPVGWFDAAGQGEFAVALRCALLAQDEAWLYAGAGIVEGAQPLREWEETVLKLRPMLEALGGRP